MLDIVCIDISLFFDRRGVILNYEHKSEDRIVFLSYDKNIARVCRKMK